MRPKDEGNKIVENLFLHPKPVKMLVALKMGNIKYATQVSKFVDCTYSHTVKVLDMFKQLGLVEFDKKGRIKLIRLTPEGEEIAHDFEGVSKKLARISGKIKIEQKPEKAKK